MNESKEKSKLKRLSRYAIFTHRSRMNKVPLKSKKPKILKLKKGIMSNNKLKSSITKGKPFVYSRRNIRKDSDNISHNQSSRSILSDKKSAKKFREKTLRLKRHLEDSNLTIKMDTSDMQSKLPTVRSKYH